jgi:hypothetical protein
MSASRGSLLALGSLALAAATPPPGEIDSVFPAAEILVNDPIYQPGMARVVKSGDIVLVGHISAPTAAYVRDRTTLSVDGRSIDIAPDARLERMRLTTRLGGMMPAGTPVYCLDAAVTRTLVGEPGLNGPRLCLVDRDDDSMAEAAFIAVKKRWPILVDTGPPDRPRPRLATPVALRVGNMGPLPAGNEVRLIFDGFAMNGAPRFALQMWRNGKRQREVNQFNRGDKDKPEGHWQYIFATKKLGYPQDLSVMGAIIRIQSVDSKANTVSITVPQLFDAQPFVAFDNGVTHIQFNYIYVPR